MTWYMPNNDDDDDVNTFSDVSVRCNWHVCCVVADVSVSVIGCQSVSRDTSGQLHLTCLEYAGDSTLYVGTSSGHVSAWDTRQNTCFMHWQADTASTHEIGRHRHHFLRPQLCATGLVLVWVTARYVTSHLG